MVQAEAFMALCTTNGSTVLQGIDAAALPTLASRGPFDRIVVTLSRSCDEGLASNKFHLAPLLEAARCDFRLLVTHFKSSLSLAALSVAPEGVTPGTLQRADMASVALRSPLLLSNDLCCSQIASVALRWPL